MSKDFLGNEIHAGMTLVYPIRRGSRMWLEKITVSMVSDTQIKGYAPDGRLKTIKNIQTTVAQWPNRNNRETQP